MALLLVCFFIFIYNCNIRIKAGNAPANPIMLQMSIEDSNHLISDITVRSFVADIIKNSYVGVPILNLFEILLM